MNPYTTPKSRQSSNKKPLNSELREIVVGWERMRILYNIILFIVGIIAILALTRSPHFELSEAILPAISFGIFANICFCAGPAAETYIRAIFNTQNIKLLRLCLFILGTLFSLIPACLSVLASEMTLNINPGY